MEKLRSPKGCPGAWNKQLVCSVHVADNEPDSIALDNLPPEVTTEDCDLFKQVREKALQV